MELMEESAVVFPGTVPVGIYETVLDVNIWSNLRWKFLEKSPVGPLGAILGGTS